VITVPVLELFLHVTGDQDATATRPPIWRRWAGACQQWLLFPDNEVRWSRRVRSHVGRGRPPWDLVVCCARPESVGLIGQHLQRHGVRWWFDFADGWCHQGLRPAAMTPGRRRRRELALERRWLSAADVVSTVDEMLAAYLREVRGRDVMVYPNVIPAELKVPAPAGRPSGDLRVAHLGRLTGSDGARSLRPLVTGLRDHKVAFEFRGELGADDRREIQALRDAGHSASEQPSCPRSDLAQLRSCWDAALVIASPAQRGSSSKLLDAIGLRLPVFALVPGDSVAADIVRRTGCGVVAPLEDPDSVARLWQQFDAGVRSAAFAVDDGAIAPLSGDAHLAGLLARMREATRELDSVH